jgi:hypothetical protein
MKQFKDCLKFLTFDSYPCKWVGENNEVVTKRIKIIEKEVFQRYVRKSEIVTLKLMCLLIYMMEGVR